MSKELTDRQAEILEWVADYIDEQGYPPTLKEIANEHGISSPNAVREHLHSMQQKGYIDRTPNISRGITIIQRPEEGS